MVKTKVEKESSKRMGNSPLVRSEGYSEGLTRIDGIDRSIGGSSLLLSSNEASRSRQVDRAALFIVRHVRQANELRRNYTRAFARDATRRERSLYRRVRRRREARHYCCIRNETKHNTCALTGSQWRKSSRFRVFARKTLAVCARIVLRAAKVHSRKVIRSSLPFSVAEYSALCVCPPLEPAAIPAASCVRFVVVAFASRILVVSNAPRAGVRVAVLVESGT